METDDYRTIGGESVGEFRDRGSKFIAYAFPVADENDWQPKLEVVKKEHPKARHHCYAWRLGMTKNHFRANDDGEPSGTAGRPILGQIDSAGLTNVLVVVVRYFGGTLLGTSGLINAYKTSAADALSKAEIVKKTVKTRVRLAFDYSLMSEVMTVVKKMNLEIVAQHYEAEPMLEIAIPKSETTQKLIQLKAGILKMPLEMVAENTLVPGLKITENIAG